VPQDYLGAELGKKYYKPTNRGHEKNIAAYLQKLTAAISKPPAVSEVKT
jgi:replication-associated recombination protein RarA